ncbi:MAG: hypothetical protein IKF36_06215 [Bacilli bacterium]|nr:hypothetical protein [Bacilli bacterium]
MTHRYYFLNGKKGTGKTLFLPENEEVRRDFTDISNIDLITMNLKGEQKREFIGKYNPDEELNGLYYVASYPHGIYKKEDNTYVYPAFFDISNEKTIYYLEKLKEYAEERKWKAEHGESIRLDDTPSFEKFREDLMYKVFDINDTRITHPDSLVALKLKDEIKKRYLEHSDMDTTQFIKSRSEIIKNILSNYTQLRLFIMEYMCLKSGEYNYKLRNSMNNIASWKHEKMTPATKDMKKKEIYKQLVLSDFIDLK